MLHLGLHVVGYGQNWHWPGDATEEDQAERSLDKQQILLEMLPNQLEKRTFDPVASEDTVLPGYWEAPRADKPMAIVFVKVGGASFGWAVLVCPCLVLLSPCTMRSVSSSYIAGLLAVPGTAALTLRSMLLSLHCQCSSF